MSLLNVKRGATPENDKTISLEITFGSADDKYVPVPWAARCIAAYTAIDASNGTTTQGDEVITLFNASGTTMQAGATASQITVAGGSAAGAVDSTTGIDTNNLFAAGEALKFSPDGGGATPSATIVFVFSLDNV